MMPRIIIYMLAAVPLGINPKLSFLEVKSLADRRKEHIKPGKIIKIYSNDLKFYKRLAFFRIVGKYWGSFRKNFGEFAKETGLAKYTLENSPFYVKTFPGGFEKKFGWWLEGRVDVKRSKTKVFFIREGKRWHVICPAHEIRNKDFSERDARNRPFFHPASMNAREARLVVNLTGVLPGESFLDPFCGAGGIMIEAAMVGARVFGTDIDEKMVEGARTNLKHYGLYGNVKLCDAREVEGKYDAVGTDLPYGRSSKADKNLKKLYRESFEHIASILKRDRYFVFIAPFDCTYMLEEFKSVKTEKMFVHSSLTRWFHICRV